MIADLRRLLSPLLARRLTAPERRQLAADLHALAAEQERLADADRRIGHVVRRAAEEAAPRSTSRGGRPKGSGGSFIRWSPPEPGRRSGQLHIAPKLWRDVGGPQRLDVQRIGGRLELRPCLDPDGWQVTFPTGARGGMPRLSIGQEPADTLGLVEGRHAATISGGAIYVD